MKSRSGDLLRAALLAGEVAPFRKNVPPPPPPRPSNPPLPKAAAPGALQKLPRIYVGDLHKGAASVYAQLQARDALIADLERRIRAIEDRPASARGVLQDVSHLPLH